MTVASLHCTMNKKTPIKKLTLNHSTVRILGTKELTAVAGGDYFSKISVCIFNQCVTQ